MITYSKDHLLLIKHSLTLLTQRADEDVISILTEHSCPIAQHKRRNRCRRGWMADLRRVAPDKMTLPNVLACNARSIFNKSEDLNSLAKSKMNRNLCAVAVTETWLNADIDSSLVTPPGFRCFRTDRACKSNTRGEGTAIFINQRWSSSPKQSFAYARDNIEATAVTCRTKLSCKFLSFIICSIYIPPSTRTPQLTAFFDSFNAFLAPLAKRFSCSSIGRFQQVLQ